jgi:dolichol kinase
MHLLLDVLTAAGLLGLFAAGQRAWRLGTPAESTRLAVHVAGASVAATFPLYLGLLDVIILGAGFTAFLTVTWARGSIGSVHGVRRPTVGALVFPIGLTATALVTWSHPAAFSFGALVLALADPAAHLAGNAARSRSWSIPGGMKSMAGSLAFLAVTLMLAFLFTWAMGTAALWPVITVSLLLTAIEGVLGYGLDNLPLPIAAALLGRYALGL